MSEKFLVCKNCGNIVEVISDSRVPMMCCGEKMVEMKANTSDGVMEKHVPVINVSGNKVSVKVGSVLHPMLEKHYIQWIYLKTNKGIQKKFLNPGEEPKGEFLLLDNEVALEVYEYCNLHGLWKNTL